MTMSGAVVVDYDIVTPYGVGVDALWQGLASGVSALRPCRTEGLPDWPDIPVGMAPLADEAGSDSRLLRLLRRLFADAPAPPDSALLLATTTGEIDLLEQALLQEASALPPSALLPPLQRLTGARGAAAVWSSACASATAALAQAALLLEDGSAESVLVVGADGLSEFVLSGFSSLMALDRGGARPFDRDRAGLCVGEAAGYMLLMSAARAARAGVAGKGRLCAGAVANDANHMTGPSRDGSGLARAIRRALALDEGGSGPMAFVAAHGTGTVYNDAMEMKALRSVFPAPVPAFSIKGAIGHTMGNAGLAQAVVALEALRRGEIPPTVGLSRPDELAVGWVTAHGRPIRGDRALVVNAGFGGVNAAVTVQGGAPASAGRTP